MIEYFGIFIISAMIYYGIRFGYGFCGDKFMNK